MPSEGLSVCLSVCMKRVRCRAKALLVIYSTATISIIYIYLLFIVSIISMSAIFYIAEKAHA